MNLRGYYNQAMLAASLMREYSLFLVLFTYLRAIVTFNYILSSDVDTLSLTQASHNPYTHLVLCVRVALCYSRCIVFLFDTLVNCALGSHLANKDTVM